MRIQPLTINRTNTNEGVKRAIRDTLETLEKLEKVLVKAKEREATFRAIIQRLENDLSQATITNERLKEAVRYAKGDKVRIIKHGDGYGQENIAWGEFQLTITCSHQYMNGIFARDENGRIPRMEDAFDEFMQRYAVLRPRRINEH